MRVFQLNTFCGVKSTGRITTEIAALVEADGGACKIGYGAGVVPAQWARFAYRVGTPLERKVSGLSRKLLDSEGYGCVLGTEALVREMRAFQPDLVHLHNIHGCYLNHRILFDYFKSAGFPVLWTLHDCWPFTGHCAYFDYVGCQKWQTGCYDCPQLKSYPICHGVDGSRRNYARKKRLFSSLDNLTFAVPCQWMKRPLGQSFLSAYPVRTIYNGVNLNAFKPVDSDLRRRYGLEGKRIVLSVASDWDARKGLRYLTESAKRLGEDFSFVVIGVSREQAEALPTGMLGIPHTANEAELAAWYTAADCLANPTMEDNMPMVNLEALACGTPVAVFETGGCPEAVNTRCGRVVERGSTDALCKAIQELCGQKSEIHAACLERAAQFDSRRTFASYLGLYKELYR